VCQPYFRIIILKDQTAVSKRGATLELNNFKAIALLLSCSILCLHEAGYVEIE